MKTAGRNPPANIETLEADSLVLALGQNVDTSVLERIPGVSLAWDGVVEVNENMMTGAEGIFAGGDMVPSERTVTIATGHGKKAAQHIDAWLRGTVYHKEPAQPTVDFKALHLRYYTDAQQRQQANVPAEKRTRDFREVMAGLTAKEAQFEAARCYSCGNCFECDGCFGACPERRHHQARQGQALRQSTTTCARVARPVSCNAPATPSKWSPRRSGHEYRRKKSNHGRASTATRPAPTSPIA